jgi:hypothetical protein
VCEDAIDKGDSTMTDWKPPVEVRVIVATSQGESEGPLRGNIQSTELMPPTTYLPVKLRLAGMTKARPRRPPPQHRSTAASRWEKAPARRRAAAATCAPEP